MSNRLVKNFINFVKINSESGEEQEFIRYLYNLFIKEFEADCTIDNYGNLIVKIEPKNCRNHEPILFSVHADTVKPGKGIKPILENGITRSKGNTILGADDKAGIAELIEAIYIAERHPALEIVISREEEIGCMGAQNIDISVLKSRIGFLIDTDALNSVVIGGPSHMFIDIEISGKGAHAGVEPEKGVSAILAASLAITKLKLGRIDEETTANIGIIEGGSVRNGIPERVRISAECRSLEHNKCIKLANTMKKVFENSAEFIGAKAEVKMNLMYEAVQISKNSETVQIAVQAVKTAGLNPRVHLITAGTDASVYNSKGIETVIIGTGGKSEHSIEENITVEDMEKAVIIVKTILEKLCDY